MAFTTPLALLVFSWLGLQLFSLFYNVFLHPLRKYPGPLWARASRWWKAYVQLVKGENWTDELVRLHGRYGDIVRVGPNELHFAKPSAYYEIYNQNIRWDKDKGLYQSFEADGASFTFLKYGESKQRKDVLLPLFSRRAILSMQGLVRRNIDNLVRVLAQNDKDGKSSDLFLAFRSFTLDTITAFCFAQSVNATRTPNFASPLTESLEASLPAFILFGHFPLLRKLVFSLPRWLAVRFSPSTTGLIELQVMLEKQIKEAIADPESLKAQPHPTIYHRLLDPEAHKGHPIPSKTSLLSEGQSMMFAGGDTVANTLMIGFFHIMDQPKLHESLREEVLRVWPNRDSPPPFETLEPLPLLTATIKEALRVTPGVPAPCLRVVPPAGATISGCSIPAGTIVGMSAIFVHSSSEIFKNPQTFNADRWLADDSKTLDQWLVAFSKGPRSCLGVNLGWCELYIAFATMLRCFDLENDGTGAEDLVWKDCFVPWYYGRHLQAWCRPVKT